MIGTHLVYVYTNDTAWLNTIWSQYRHAMDYLLGKMTANNLLNVTATADWARNGQGGENVAANAIYYGVLQSGCELAIALNEPMVCTQWSATATKVKAAINYVLWDNTKGALRDNPTSTVYPQDGNSFAVQFGVVDGDRQKAVSDYLSSNWNHIGARAPEWNFDIGTFPGSAEVHAHFLAGHGSRAVDLITRQWGYMLDYPQGTNSTFWEGFHQDGTFAYQGIYMSNAHGWATGPTSALSFYVLGLRPTSPIGMTYMVAPQPSGLTHAEGQLTMDAASRVVHVSWSVQNNVDCVGM
jgi:hypothetical protein